MDTPGWHAFRRADKESQYYAAHGGSYGPVEQVGPMEESFIGGFYGSQHPPSPGPPPPLPPRDGSSFYAGYAPPIRGPPAPPMPGFPTVPDSRPPGPGYPPHPPFDQPAFPSHAQQAYGSEKIMHLNPAERSQMLRVARMNPHLQFMCGPLLRFDTIDSQGIWRGAALIVTSDSGSIYDPYPKLSYEWDPDKFTTSTLRAHGGSVSQSAPPWSNASGSQDGHHPAFELGPHPADPHSTMWPISPSVSSSSSTTENMNPNLRREEAFGQELWVYAGTGGIFTFWRFLIQIPLANREMEITYRINNGQALNFFVPGRNQNMRWAAHSCNGFSAGVNPDDFRGPGFQSGYDPLWVDLLNHHAETPFHALVGGGDQLYCDSLIREPEMQDWAAKLKPEEKKQYPLTEEIRICIDRFLFNHYCQSFRRGAFARANSSIPMVNMCDDHDLIDGFGSYPDDLQRAPVFRHIGDRGYFFFLIFQCFVNPELDGLSDAPGKHVFQSTVFGQMGPYIKQPSHSILTSLGPQVALLALDCRAERKKDQVCSSVEYDRVFQRIRALPPNVEHLVILVGIPIAYPRMVFLESALESKFNPLVALGRNGSLGLSGFVNKFNADAELLDDLNDHWTARMHKHERNWFIEQLQTLASKQRLRISFVSGDVHCGAVGVLKTLKGRRGAEIPAQTDHRYMVNVVTSAIVNTPPPGGVLTMVNQLATKQHKTLHYAQTDEIMLPLFGTDTDGTSRRQKYVIGRRNWCSVDWGTNDGNLLFTLRIEKEKGIGTTAPYPTSAPPPGWARK